MKKAIPNIEYLPEKRKAPILRRGPGLLHLFCVLLLFQAYFPLFSQKKYESAKNPKKNLQAPQKIQFRGTIKNGSASLLRSLPDVELIRLSGGMELVEKTTPKGSSFVFSPISVEELTSPYLVRVNYQGASYSHLIPPSEKFWKRKLTLYVYDSGAELKDLQITSALQVSKKEGGLTVEKVFLIQNLSSPPRSFPLEQIYFFIPPNAKNIRAGIRYENKGVAIPLSPLRDNKQGHSFKHGLRPGQAELNIHYETYSYQLKDRRRSPFQDRNSPKQVLIWRPPDAEPKVKGAKYSVIDIPNIGPAYQIEYGAKNEVSYDFRGGSVLIEDPLNKDKNPLFDSPLKTIISVFVILVYLLLFVRFLTPKIRD